MLESNRRRSCRTNFALNSLVVETNRNYVITNFKSLRLINGKKTKASCITGTQI